MVISIIVASFEIVILFFKQDLVSISFIANQVFLFKLLASLSRNRFQTKLNINLSKKTSKANKYEISWNRISIGTRLFISVVYFELLYYSSNKTWCPFRIKFSYSSFYLLCREIVLDFETEFRSPRSYLYPLLLSKLYYFQNKTWYYPFRFIFFVVQIEKSYEISWNRNRH